MPMRAEHRVEVIERTVAMRAGVGGTARIVQHAELTSHSVTTDHPILVMIEQGSKHVSWPGGACTAHAGDTVALAAGRTFDITNRLSTEGQYEAFWIVFDPAMIDGFLTRPRPSPPRVRDAVLLRHMQPAFRAAYDAARSCIVDPAEVSDEIARHRLLELLLWLEQHGSCFGPLDLTTFRSRVRQLIASDPSFAWTSGEISARLSMSCPTLRRRLATENVCLRRLLQDIRMSHALTLLQSTDQSILDIALHVGYDSPSRFAIRFKQRWGFAPSAVRGHHRDRKPLVAYS